MSQQQLEQRLIELTKAYERGDLLTSDSEFDALYRELMTLYPQSTVLSSIITNSTELLKHETPMLSLSNAFTTEEVKGKLSLLKEQEKIIEYKYDGFAISLVYKQGKLQKALTRGNGEEGEDITLNASMVEDIPLVLKERIDITVRGEVYMPITSFNRLNEEGYKLSSPRNAAAGTIRLKNDLAEVKKRGLKFVAYDTVYSFDGSIQYQTLTNNKELLYSLGFKNVAPTLARYKEDEKILKFIENFNSNFEEEIARLSFDIDGLVIKLNDKTISLALGYTGKYPKYAFAYKFQDTDAITTVKEIITQVGRTGVITPVAELEPVAITGSTVSFCTLHNFQHLLSLGLHQGDKVYIRRSGGVIPKITQVVESNQTDSFKVPENCPSCDSKLDLSNLKVVVCPNESCMQRLRSYLDYVCSRAVLDIKNISLMSIEKLIRKNNIRQPQDFFFLTVEQLKEVLGEKKGEDVYRAMRSRFGLIELDKFLLLLNIPNIASSTTKLMGQNFKTYQELVEDKDKKLPTLLGVKTYQKWLDFIELDKVKGVANSLLGLFKVTRLDPPDRPLEKFCFTGVIEDASRTELNKRFFLVDSVSKADFVVVGDKPSPTKVSKAESLGKTIIQANSLSSLYKALASFRKSKKGN